MRCKVVGCDRRFEQLQQCMQRCLHVRRANPVEVVRGERLPSLPHALAQAVEIECALTPQMLVRLLTRLCEERTQRHGELAGRPERAQAEGIDQNQPTHAIGVPACKAGRDRTTEQLACKRRRGCAGPVDQLGKPRQHALHVERSIAEP